MGWAIVAGCTVAWLAALSTYDLSQRRLPNALTLPGAVLVWAVAVVAGRGVPAILGSITLTTLYLAVHLAAPRAMGAGDVKLALGIGGLTGAFGTEAWVLAAVGAPFLTGTWGIVAALRKSGRTVPHGPSMCLAASVAIAPGIF